MSNNSQNYIFGGLGTDILTNQETISGAGTIGSNQMTLVNSGTINADQSAGMTINPNGGVTNTGTIEATAGANLTFTNTTVGNAGGKITANTGTLQVNNATINGGTVSLVGSSTLELNNGTVHGGTLTTVRPGPIDIASGFSNYLGGTINNSAGGILSIANNNRSNSGCRDVYATGCGAVEFGGQHVGTCNPRRCHAERRFDHHVEQHSETTSTPELETTP